MEDHYSTEAKGQPISKQAIQIHLKIHIARLYWKKLNLTAESQRTLRALRGSAVQQFFQRTDTAEDTEP